VKAISHYSSSKGNLYEIIGDSGKRILMSLKKRQQEQYDICEEEGLLVVDPPMPKNMMVELSNACNHACVFCPNPHMQRGVGRINRALLIEIMSDAVRNGVTEIGFYTTGDPFIHQSTF